MRIRSIRPEFWTSEDIAALTWEHRLIFIGLWSYVDDNGVGRDSAKLIAADLFPLEDDTHGALLQVAGALRSFETRGLITRYSVAGKPYLHVTTWSTHQKINRPSDGRYPLPTCDDAVSQAPLTEPSLSPHADSPVGEGEKGRRGEGENSSSASADAERGTDDFDSFWSLYPRKVGKGHAVKAFRVARKKASQDVILDGLRRYLPIWAGKAMEYTPHAATWLAGERWADEVETTGVQQQRRLTHVSQLATPPPGLSDEESSQWMREQRERRGA